MTKQPMGEGFRFRKLAAWAPAILILVGLFLVVWGRSADAPVQAMAGWVFALAGVVFGILVKRRARQAEGSGTANE